MSRFTEAATVLLPALEWYRAEGPPLEELQTQTLLARLKRSAGEFDEAFALFSTARDRAYLVENLSAAAAAAHGMASIRLARERFRESITLFSAAAEDARKAGDAGFEGYAVCTQSAALRALGHWREAAAAAERGMQLARQGRNDRLLLACLPNAAAAYAVGAQPAQAQAALDELRAVSLRLEGARESPHLLSLQALLLYHGGQPAKASALCETRLLPAAKAPAATAETALVCSIYADRAGKLARAAELAAHATPYFAAQQLLHSHWLALALAGRLPEAAAARDRFEATLTPDDAAAYRTHPDVARCGRRLAN
jgi:hypothetical protein